MSWMIWAVLAAVFWAVANIIDKHVVEKRVKKATVPVMVLAIVGLIGGLVSFAINGFVLLPINLMIWALVAGAFYAIMILFYFIAAKREEISRVVPLLYTAPLFVAILAAMFIGESLNLGQYFGVGLIIAGALLISYKGSFKLGKTFWFCILAAFTIAISEVITKYLLNYTDYWTVFGYSRIGSFIGLIPIFFLYSKDLVKAVKEVTPAALMSLSEIITVVGLLFLTVAFSLGDATLVSALNSIQPFIVLIFSIILSIFLPKIVKEEISAKIIGMKALAILLVFIGVVLLT